MVTDNNMNTRLIKKNGRQRNLTREIIRMRRQTSMKRGRTNDLRPDNVLHLLGNLLHHQNNNRRHEGTRFKFTKSPRTLLRPRHPINRLLRARIKATRGTRLQFNVFLLPRGKVINLCPLRLNVIGGVFPNALDGRNITRLRHLKNRANSIMRARHTIENNNNARILGVNANLINRIITRPFIRTRRMKRVLRRLRTSNKTGRLYLQLFNNFRTSSPDDLTTLINRRTSIKRVTNGNTRSIRSTKITITPNARRKVNMRRNKKLHPKRCLTLLQLITRLIRVTNANRNTIIRRPRVLRLLFVIFLNNMRSFIRGGVLRRINERVLIRQTKIGKRLLNKGHPIISRLLRRLRRKNRRFRTRENSRIIMFQNSKRRLIHARNITMRGRDFPRLLRNFTLKTIRSNLLFKNWVREFSLLGLAIS